MTTKTTRRNLFGAVGAFAAGAAVATTAIGAIGTPRDPIPALVAERQRRIDNYNASPFGSMTEEEADEHCQRFCDADDEICNRIVDVVAISSAGLLAQMDLLVDMKEQCDCWADQRDARLMDSIRVGISALVTGGAA